MNTLTVTAVEVGMQTFQLAAGTPSMNVVALDREMAFDLSCNDGRSFSGTSSSDYSTGIVSNNGTVNDQPLSCTSTYQPAVPITISGPQSIEDLLLNALTGDDSNPDFIISDCPDDDFDNLNPFTTACTGSILTNITATDINGGVHLVATQLSFTTGASGNLPDVPEIPNIPEIPVIPGVPDIPNAPNDAPDFSDVPDFSDIPGLPDGIPDFSNIPGFPDGAIPQ